MKKLVLFLSIALALSSCKMTGFSAAGTTEKNYVSNFLQNMKDDAVNPEANMMNCISRKYLTQNKLDKGKYTVNSYSPVAFSIESYSNKGIVTAKIWGDEKGWIHRLTFKLVMEDGKIYLWPKSHSDAYIDPWYEVEQYIKE